MTGRGGLRLGLVTEAFAERPLPALLAWLAAEAPQITALEVGVGGYAPVIHCDPPALLRSDAARRRYLAEIEGRGIAVAALNAWGNPLHPDPDIARRHDADLRDAVRLGAWTALSAFAAREHPGARLCIELHPGTCVYNLETFERFARLGPNLVATVDPSHLVWMGMDPREVVAALPRIGHAHAKDVRFNEGALAVNGLLDHRWSGGDPGAPWTFATVGHGRDAQWWGEFRAALAARGVETLAIEHEDPSVAAETGVVEAAGILAGPRVAAGGAA